MIWIDEQHGITFEKTRNDRYVWTRKYFIDGITGINPEMQAYMLARQFITAHVNTQQQQIQTISVAELEDGKGIWTATCKFTSPTMQKYLAYKNLPDYSFSTKGGTAHITQSKETMAVYPGSRPVMTFTQDEMTGGYSYEPTGETEPLPLKNFQGGIGYNGETFDGVDITVPAWKATIKLTVKDYVIDQNYLQMLRMLTGAVNNAPFDGFAPGECRFMGCDGTRRVQELERNYEPGNELEIDKPPEYEIVWDLTFEFEAAPNYEQFIDGLGMCYKNGWDYLWILRQPLDYQTTQNENQQTTETQNQTVKTIPTAAYVERVYEYADFSIFGLDFISTL
jgi:hypothetical protein